MKENQENKKQTILRGYKTELDLNDRQRSACLRHAGTARFAYNWGLARKQAAYASGERMPTAIDLHKALNALKQTEFAWMYAVSKCAPQEALRDLDQAFARFFERVKARKAGKQVEAGYPRFKSRKTGVGKFRLTGSIRGFENAIQVEEEIEKPKKNKHKQPKAGGDLGVLRLATLSDGSVYENPRALKHAMHKIKPCSGRFRASRRAAPTGPRRLRMLAGGVQATDGLQGNLVRL